MSYPSSDGEWSGCYLPTDRGQRRLQFRVDANLADCNFTLPEVDGEDTVLTQTSSGNLGFTSSVRCGGATEFIEDSSL